MSAERFDDREIRDLLADLYIGPPPDYADDAVRRATRVRQRPGWTFIDRWFPMSLVILERVPTRMLPLRSIAIAVILLLVVIAAAVVVGTWRPMPDPFGPAGNGRLAYAEGGDIRVVDPLTGSDELLIGGFTDDGEPRWSLDGTRLAFIRRVPSGNTIAVVDANGSNLLVGAERYESIDPDSIAWSPDGRTVAFNGGSRLAAGIVLFDAIDGSTRRVAAETYAGLQVLWRPPDGRELLYSGRDDHGRSALFLVSVDDGSVRQLDGRDGFPPEHRPTGWTPDGRRLLYGIGGLTRILDVETGSVRELPLGFGQPSNDGTRVAGFQGLDSGLRLCVMPIDGGACVDIARGRDAPIPTTHMDLQWLPDDQWILVTPGWPGGPAFLVDPADGDVQRPSWLPATADHVQRIAPP